MSRTVRLWLTVALLIVVWLALNALLDGTPSETKTDRLIAEASADLAAIEAINNAAKVASKGRP